ncbi:hypothetical protein BX070DRAFT_223030, partial [Coemansia spiralis]
MNTTFNSSVIVIVIFAFIALVASREKKHISCVAIMGLLFRFISISFPLLEFAFVCMKCFFCLAFHVPFMLVYFLD